MFRGTGADCPSEEELAELAERGLSAEASAGIEVHIARCASCRSALAGVIGAVSRPDPRPDDPAPLDGPALAPGTLVGRYRVEELLGSGAMGTVYVALDPELDRRVAVKVLRSGVSDDAEDLGHRLRREAKAMAKLSHPNVVTVFDVGTSDGHVFIAMELVAGGTLREWLAAAPRSWREVVDVFVLAGRGLSAAHSAGLVHRDFKPDNVLVTREGDVRVTDFGLARAALDAVPFSSGPNAPHEPTDAESRLTRTGTVIGTPAYMAPEQLDRESADARSDLFSFCVALWESLYGQRPFVGATLSRLREAIRRGQAAPEPTADVPEAMRSALLVGLRDDPAERYPSMAPLLETLARSADPRLHVPLTGAERKVSTLPKVSRATLATLALLATLLVFVSFGLARGWAGRGAASSSATPAAVTSVIPPTTLLDLPAPQSDSPEALAAFADGMRALHDGGWARARDAFARAAAADPSLAAAHLRLAVMSSGSIGTVTQTRLEFQKASELRARLAVRDQVFLEALEPLLQRTPADHAEATARFRRAVERYPNDAELHLWLGYNVMDSGVGDPTDALRLFAEVSAMDPRYADALESEGKALAWLGRISEARDVLEKCIAIPTALDCLYWLKFVDAGAGDCAACERDARRRIDRDPLSLVGYWNLADAFLALGRPSEAARAALVQDWTLWDEPNRAREALAEEANFDIVRGDFAHARALADRELALIESDPEGVRHLRTTTVLVGLALETGDTKAAGELADAFVKRAGAWATTEGSFDKVADKLPWLMHVARREGTLSAEDFEAARAEWVKIRREARRASGYLWVLGYADAADTPDEAREALAKLPELGSLPPFFLVTGNADLPVGRVYALAGRAEEAAPHLARAAKNCVRLGDPFAHPHAELEVGLLDESEGDAAGACEAYQAVVAQWGNAKPRSVTAERARARIRALGCTK